jgi:hypothetical protein
VQVWTRLAPGSAPRVIGALPRECLSDLTFLSLTQPPLHTAPLQYPQNTTADHRYAYLQEGQSMLAPSTPAFTPLTATHRSSVSTRQPTRLAPARPSRRTVCPSRPRSRLRSCVLLCQKYDRLANCVAVPELPPRDCQHQQSAARGTRRQPQQRLAKGEVLAQRLQMSVASKKLDGPDGHLQTGQMCWHDTGVSTRRVASRQLCTMSAQDYEHEKWRSVVYTQDKGLKADR